MQRTPVVDVGIPAYMRPTYIVETIESVLAQTFTDWRLTVSDDSPNGETVHRAVEPFLSDSRVRYVPNQAPNGETANWNRLVELADAPYVAILHDDDRWHPDFLRRRVAFLDRHPECGFVFSGRTHIDESGALLGVWHPPLDPGVYGAKEFSRLLLEANLVGSTVTVLMRRSACDAVGPFFDHRFPHADYEMWFRLATRFPVGYVAARDADYRLHTSSTSRQLRATHGRVVALAERLLELAERGSPGELGFDERRRVYANVLLEEISFDALGAGDRRYASSLLLEALRAWPRSAFDARVLDWVRIAVGPRARRRIARARGGPLRHSQTA
jgi:glycosyltransferase involved in cell wall biosynthesis